MNYETQTTAHLLELQRLTIEAYEASGRDITHSIDYERIRKELDKRRAVQQSDKKLTLNDMWSFDGQAVPSPRIDEMVKRIRERQLARKTTVLKAV